MSSCTLISDAKLNLNMKNLIYLVLMTITLLSCQEKEEVMPTRDSNGRLSVRFVAKNNETNQPYLHYNNANVIFIIPSGGTRGGNATAISVTGKQDVDHKFETNVFFQTMYNPATSLPEYSPLDFYSFNYIVDGKSNFVNLRSSSPSEGIFITKNDADSLGGTFKIKMEEMPQGSSTNYKEMEGYFCIAKKGVL